MGWKKSGIPMLPSVYGRVLLHTTFTKKENWLTVLIIRNLKESDSGDYTFTVKVGPAVMSVTRSILVLPKQGQLFFFFNFSHQKQNSKRHASVLIKILRFLAIV